MVSDGFEGRLELARALGAPVALSAAADVVGEVQALTGGRGADCALLAAPGQAAFDQAVSATRPGGRILSFAATSPGEAVEAADRDTSPPEAAPPPVPEDGATTSDVAGEGESSQGVKPNE